MEEDAHRDSGAAENAALGHPLTEDEICGLAGCLLWRGEQFGGWSLGTDAMDVPVFLIRCPYCSDEGAGQYHTASGGFICTHCQRSCAAHTLLPMLGLTRRDLAPHVVAVAARILLGQPYVDLRDGRPWWAEQPDQQPESIGYQCRCSACHSCGGVAGVIRVRSAQYACAACKPDCDWRAGDVRTLRQLFGAVFDLLGSIKCMGEWVREILDTRREEREWSH